MQGSPPVGRGITPPEAGSPIAKAGDTSLPQTRAQIWGTLKRYLAYTTAGFVVLGGVGAMEAAQPPVVSRANAAQTLQGTVSAEALLASNPTTPSWTQRLRFDLAPMVSAVAASSHQNNAPRPPAPYYPAPDTSWTKEAAVADAESSDAAEPAPEVAVADATPEVIRIAANETLLTPPVVVTPPVVAAPPVVEPPAAAPAIVAPVAEMPKAEEPREESVTTADSMPEADSLVEVEPAAPEETAAAPVEETPAPADASSLAARALVATLNWVYGDTTATLPDDYFSAGSNAAAPAEETAPELPLQAAMQPATPSSAIPADAFDANVELQGVKRVIEVRRGDTLFGLLTKAGLSDAEAQAAGHSLADVFSPNDLRVGQEITLNLANDEGPDTESDNKLVALTLQPNMERDVKLTRDAAGQFVAAAIERPLTERIDRAAGQIDISLFESAREAGVPAGLIGDVIKAYSYDVDFQRDIHEGDSFEVMYERFDNDKGDLAKAGRLLYASLTLGGNPMPIYYFERDGDGEYFTADGVAVRKSLLKTPIDGARITSGYGMRVNPVLGYSAMHQGIDFGAPTGTPIFAAGNGVIEQIGWKNGYGKYIKVRHNGTYETAYGHTSRFASGLKKGSKVKQGQVIAYVGATGRATGPHLHFEIIINGKHVNPSTVKTVASDKLTGPALKAFKRQVAAIQNQRRELANRAEIADQSGAAPALDCNRPRGCLN
jgi:murein DD-endopeptidase MepM/ murein hydrolase activator NlpD